MCLFIFGHNHIPSLSRATPTSHKTMSCEGGEFTFITRERTFISLLNTKLSLILCFYFSLSLSSHFFSYINSPRRSPFSSAVAGLSFCSQYCPSTWCCCCLTIDSWCLFAGSGASTCRRSRRRGAAATIANIIGSKCKYYWPLCWQSFCQCRW